MSQPFETGAPVLAKNRARILVVDDEASLLRIVARVLTTAGYDVTTVSDGRQAIEILTDATFDTILSDIDMPKMNGIQLLQIVRRRDLDVPVILFTGQPDVKTAMQAVAHGALQYLIKPVDLDELRQIVARGVRLNHVAKLKREALAVVNEGGLGIGDHIALDASFDRALATLWIAFQPIVRIADRTSFGFEALLRSEEASLPHPGAILDAAERLGRVHELGRQIRARASEAILKSEPGATFFVNLHPNDLLDDSLLSPQSPLSAVAERVVLEITERASLDGIKDAREKIAALRKLGFKIAIDDLGAGYAGLTSFVTLEPEFVKLDMSLIRDVDKSSMKEKLVRSMTLLCKDLGMVVVAEGVETKEERDVLVAIGCDLLQGYLLARPGRAFPSFVW